MTQSSPNEIIIEKTKTKVKKPPMFKVILHNDDYTPMDFVVLVLKSIFNKSLEESNKLMMNVHLHGSSVCGVFTYDIAETKVIQVTHLAESQQYPLKCTMERE